LKIPSIFLILLSLAQTLLSHHTCRALRGLGTERSLHHPLYRYLAFSLKPFEEGYRRVSMDANACKQTPFIASLLARLLSKFSCFKGFDNPCYQISIPRNFKRFWRFLEFALLLPILLVRFLLPKMIGYVVIAERYLSDFIVWVAVMAKDEGFLKST